MRFWNVLWRGVCLLSIALIASQAFCQTNVSGLISSNTTWSLSGSPYHVKGNLLVDSAVTLTIQPGVVVEFDTAKSMEIDGTLNARGTADQLITFTSSASTPAAGDWGYILFADKSVDAVYDSATGAYSSGSILEYAVVEYGGGVETDDHNGTLRLNDAHPLINQCTIRSNVRTGIVAWLLSGYLRITNCTISDNGSTTWDAGGIWTDDWWQKAVVIIAGNVITGNVGNSAGGIEADCAGSATISNNIIKDNAGSYTGGIYFEGNGTVDGNILSGNGGTSMAGGAMYVLWSSATVSNNVIVGNASYRGGGVYVEPTSSGGVSVLNNIFAENTATDEGGGLYVLPGYATGTSVVVEKNSFIANSAPLAAAARVSDSPGLFAYNTFQRNVAQGSSTSSAVSVSYTPLFNYNNLLDDSVACELYNVNGQGSSNVDATNNWWGTSISGNVDGKIYDWFDNSSLGLTTYSPILASIGTSAPVSTPTGLSLSGTGPYTLTWTANPESDIAGYKVYWDTSDELQYANAVDAGNTTSYASLPAGSYYVTVTAYDSMALSETDLASTVVNEKQTAGHESWFAAPVSTSGATAVNSASGTVYQFGLNQNYPNPFNPSTTFSFTLPRTSQATLKVFDILGREVATVLDGQFSAGIHSVTWNASRLSSGVYFYRLQTGQLSSTRRLTLVK